MLRPPSFNLSAAGAGWSRWHSAGFFEFEQTFSDFGSYVLTSHYPNNTCPTSPTCDPEAAGLSVGCQGSERSALHVAAEPNHTAALCAHTPGGAICPTTVALRPNRRYIVVAVVKAAFPRSTTEVNLQVFLYDSLGRKLNNTKAGGGLPNSPGPGVAGWQRHEWEFISPSYPDLARGALGVTFEFGCGNSVPALAFADLTLIESEQHDNSY